MVAIENNHDVKKLQQWAEQLAKDYLPDGWERIHSSAFTRVAHNRQMQLFFKEFLPRSPAESLKALVRGSRATRARINGDALLLAGIRSAYLWRQLGGRRWKLVLQRKPMLEASQNLSRGLGVV